MINMLKDILKKIDNMQEQMGNIIRETKILRRIKKKYQKSKMVEEKWKKKAFDGHIGRHGMTEERISELERSSNDFSHRNVKRKKRMKQNRTSKTMGQYQKVYAIGVPEEWESRVQATFKVITTENFQKLMTDTKPQIEEDQRKPSRINHQKKKNTTRHIILKLKEINEKKIERSQREK